MADNVAITAGAGTTIATDEVTIGGVAVQVQRVKPVIGADGSGTDLAPGQATMAASVPVVIASNQSDLDVILKDGGGLDLEFAKEGDAWNAADHGIILFARDVDTNPDTYRAVQVDANGHMKVSDGGDSLTVDGTVAVTNAGITTIAGAVSGTEMQCDVLTLPGGSVSITVSPTVDTAIYASGDLMGGKLTLTNAARVAAGSGLIQTVTIADQDKELSAIDVVFWSTDPSGTTFTDQAPLDVADADLLNVVGVVSVAAADYASFNDNGLATVKNIAMPFKLAAGTSLYAALVCRGTPTYTAGTDIQLRVGIIQD